MPFAVMADKDETATAIANGRFRKGLCPKETLFQETLPQETLSQVRMTAKMDSGLRYSVMTAKADGKIANSETRNFLPRNFVPMNFVPRE
jgi:hypothetical protein